MLPPTVDWDILTRYLAGETSEAENREVEAWQGSSAANKKQLEKLRKLWQASGTPAEAPEPNLNLSWDRIAAKLETPAQPQLIVEETQAERSFNLAWIWRVAAAAVLMLGAVLAFYKTRPVLDTGGMALVKFETKAGQRAEVTLPDGSQVWVNENSVLRYPKTFAADSREVSLEGEAFFDVTKNPEKPFRITAGETVTEVKGTSFNVNAYDPEKAVTVAVVTGKVQLREKDEPENQVLLTPDQTGNFDGDKVTSAETKDLNFLAWKTGVLRFKDTDLATVARDLEHYYGKTVRFQNQKLGNCHFTGTFEKQKLEDVLEVLRLTLNLQADVKDKEIELKGEGCQ